MKAFLSYAFPDEAFACRVNHYLLLCARPDLETFCWPENRRAGEFVPQVFNAVKQSDVLITVVGKRLGQTQGQEAAFAQAQELPAVLVRLPGSRPAITKSVYATFIDPIRVTGTEEEDAERCANEIAALLHLDWIPWEGLPTEYRFDYEKDIIEAYVRGEGLHSDCPQHWPQVERHAPPANQSNPVLDKEIGSYRREDSKVLVDAREAVRPRRPSKEKAKSLTLTFLEAGPRQKLSFPRPDANELTVGLLVSGGIAPGINAVIEGLVARHTLYRDRGGYELNVLGYVEGFNALLRPGENFKPLRAPDVRGVAYEGGSILGTSRAEDLLDANSLKRRDCLRRIVNHLEAQGVEILYVIGGDGSMRAAHAIWRAAQDAEQKLSVVAIPKSVDNDVLWVWQAFGFLSAVDKAREVILSLDKEIKANPRLCIIQLFGSDSGFVVSHAALASGAGVCDVALIPEMEFSMKGLSSYMLQKLKERYVPRKGGERPHGMIVMAETAIPSDVDDYIDDPDVGLNEDERVAIRAFVDNRRRVRGQTPDALRTGGLKVVARILSRDIRGMRDAHNYWESFRVIANEPRHLIRAIPPSVSDVIFAQRLGALAVDNAMAGYTDFMVSQWLTEYVLVPLPLVVLGRKRVPLDGIFWKSVLAMTDQPADLERV